VAFCCFTVLFLRAQNAVPGQTAVAPGRRRMLFLSTRMYIRGCLEHAIQSILREEPLLCAGIAFSGGQECGYPKAEGAAAQVIDLGGHFVMPGFNDAHLHLRMRAAGS